MKLRFTVSFDLQVQTSAGTEASLTFLRDFPQSLLAHLSSNQAAAASFHVLPNRVSVGG